MSAVEAAAISDTRLLVDKSVVLPLEQPSSMLEVWNWPRYACF